MYLAFSVLDWIPICSRNLDFFPHDQYIQTRIDFPNLKFLILSSVPISACEWYSSHGSHKFRPQDVSHLITWQDGRCTSDFLSSLPKPESHLNVATGFGCASILWYTKHRSDIYFMSLVVSTHQLFFCS